MGNWTLTKPPNWGNPGHPPCIATNAGWADPISGELLVAITGLSTFKEPGGHSTLVRISLDTPNFDMTEPSPSLGLGAIITLTAEYSTLVTVTGTPQVAVTINGTSRNFEYVSGSGSGYLLFQYTVVSGDIAVPGQVIPVSPIVGTIHDVSNAAVSPLTFTGTQIDKSFSLARIDGSVSATTSITGVSGAYVDGGVISAIFNFSKSVNVTGEPTVEISFGSDHEVLTYLSGSGTAALKFTFEVGPNQFAAPGQVVISSPIVLNGGTITDEVDNHATLTFTPPNTSADAVNDTAPIIVSVAGISGHYVTGGNMLPVVTFDENVVVTGVPTFPIIINGVTRNATYSSGSGTTALTFTYAVVSGDIAATDGEVTTGNTLTLAGGTIDDVAATPATLAFTAPNLSTVTVN